MKNRQIRKLALAGMLIALGVACSPLYIPVGASKCFPVQHMVNVLAAVFLGPWYGVGMAFCTSLLRNIMGTGTLLAFPGSMVGALVCGLTYMKTRNIGLTCIAEVIGTALLGGVLAFPMAKLILGNAEAALFTYVMPFAVSTIGGSIIAFVLIAVLKKSGALKKMEETIDVK